MATEAELLGQMEELNKELAGLLDKKRALARQIEEVSKATGPEREDLPETASEAEATTLAPEGIESEEAVQNG